MVLLAVMQFARNAPTAMFCLVIQDNFFALLGIFAGSTCKVCTLKSQAKNDLAQ